MKKKKKRQEKIKIKKNKQYIQNMHPWGWGLKEKKSILKIN